jgi:RNA polymerase sigma-70 factor (ECF subfamily)
LRFEKQHYSVNIMRTNSTGRLGRVRELVEKARTGDHGAFGELVRTYERPVHAVVVSCLGDSPDRPDVVQETFLAAYRALPKLREPEKFGSWLYAIASRLSKNVLRKRRRKEITFAEMGEHEEGAPEVPDGDSSEPHERISKMEVSGELARAFAGLPERQRAALTLFYSEKLTYGEIAAFLNISLASVKGLIYRGMVELKNRLPRRMES